MIHIFYSHGGKVLSHEGLITCEQVLPLWLFHCYILAAINKYSEKILKEVNKKILFGVY